MKLPHSNYYHLLKIKYQSLLDNLVMGTTLVLAICTKEYITIGHIGDSRIYLKNDERQMPKTCDSCQSEHIRFFGSGTQKVEEELTKLLPQARVIRMDVDTTSRKGSHERLLESFERGEADILLGTQMIAKGLDFPSITLVGVLAADSMLHIPDFRAAERTCFRRNCG